MYSRVVRTDGNGLARSAAGSGKAFLIEPAIAPMNPPVGAPGWFPGVFPVRVQTNGQLSAEIIVNASHLVRVDEGFDFLDVIGHPYSYYCVTTLHTGAEKIQPAGGKRKSASELWSWGIPGNPGEPFSAVNRYAHDVPWQLSPPADYNPASPSLSGLYLHPSLKGFEVQFQPSAQSCEVWILPPNRLANGGAWSFSETITAEAPGGAVYRDVKIPGGRLLFANTTDTTPGSVLASVIAYCEVDA